MSEVTESKTALKKSDLLAAVSAKPGITQEQLERKLKKSHTFIPEFMIYLIASYTGTGKIAVDAETGGMTVKETGQIRTEPRPIYNPVRDAEGHYVFNEAILNPGEKLPEFWSLSKKTAAKQGQREAYAAYKQACADLEELSAEVEAEAEAEAA